MRVVLSSDENDHKAKDVMLVAVEDELLRCVVWVLPNSKQSRCTKTKVKIDRFKGRVVVIEFRVGP